MLNTNRKLGQNKENKDSESYLNFLMYPDKAFSYKILCLLD